MGIFLIAIFLEFDFICAARTAACHSWRNPAERMMSIVNLGLQCVGMMRGKMSDEHEASISHCNNMSQLRQAAEKKPDVTQAILDSIEPVKILLTDILERLIPSLPCSSWSRPGGAVVCSGECR